MRAPLGTSELTVVAGVADTRSTPLDRLASEGTQTALESLQHVLPSDNAGRVTVAAFGSSV